MTRQLHNQPGREKRWAVLLPLLLLILPSDLFGEPQRPGKALNHLLRAALRSNYAIAAESTRVVRSEHLSRRAGRLPNPKVGISWSPVAVETRGGPQRLRASIEQPFPFFGERGLRTDLSLSELSMQEQKREGIRADVVESIHQIFWEIYRIDRSIGIWSQESRLLADIVSAAELKYSTGIGNQAHLFQVQLMETSAANRLLLLEGMRSAALDRMEGAVGIRVEVPLLLEVDDTFIPIDSSALLANAERFNPEFATASEKVRGARIRLDMARKERYPDFSLSAGWAEIGENDMPGEWSGRDVWSVGAMLSFPLYRGAIREKEMAAAAALRAAELNREDSLLQVRSSVRSLLRQTDTALQSIDIYRHGLLPQAESTLESALAAYGTGELEFADLLFAEQSLLEVKLDYHGSVALHRSLVAKLDRLTGASLLSAGEMNRADGLNEGGSIDE